MKTRKTLKKRRTSKKYNKTQFRRYNKHNNLTSKMKGGVNNYIPKNGGKSKHTVKRNVKSKKRTLIIFI